MKIIGNKSYFFALAFSTLTAVQAEEAPPPAPPQEVSNGQAALTQTSSSAFFKKEKWNIKYSNYMNGPTFTESAGASINHYLTVKHKITDDLGLGFVFRPDTNIKNGKSAFTLGDSYLSVWHPIYKADSGLSISGQVRYMLPMSESSREAKLAGVISPRVTISKTFGSLEFENVLIPKVYLNTVSAEGQTQFSIGSYANASLKLNEYVKLDLGIYPEWTFSKGAKPKFNDLALYPGFTIDFSPKVSLSPYFEIFGMNLSGNNTSVGAVLSVVFI